MKEFKNPFDAFPLRDKPWLNLNKEETSYIIYNLYRLRFISSEDVKSLVNKHRLQIVTFYAFPLIAFPITRSLVNLNKGLFRVFNPSIRTTYTMAGTALLWYVFSMVNPARLAYQKEKDNMLNYLDANMGPVIINFNNMLPRYWTENWVNEKLASLCRQRNSVFTGILYPPEGHSRTLYSLDSIPVQEGYGF